MAAERSAQQRTTHRQRCIRRRTGAKETSASRRRARVGENLREVDVQLPGSEARRRTSALSRSARRSTVARARRVLLACHETSPPNTKAGTAPVEIALTDVDLGTRTCASVGNCESFGATATPMIDAPRQRIGLRRIVDLKRKSKIQAPRRRSRSSNRVVTKYCTPKSIAAVRRRRLAAVRRRRCS